ncbi:hypothetical protein [Bradyrhizobium sp. USDA 4353]
MTRTTVRLYPGRSDINAQFSAANLRKSLADFKKIKTAGGDYPFGALTALFYRLSASEKEVWENDLKIYPKAVQDEIKRHVIAALTHVDEEGKESPVPLSISWKAGEKAVVSTYDADRGSYKVEIFGFPAPATSSLAERRSKRTT